LQIVKYYLPRITLITLILICSFSLIKAQEVTLDYIFQEPNIINPRPSLKFISPETNKVYYYADDDYNSTLDLFYYDWATNTTYKFPDTTKTPSEFELLPNGDLLMIMDGDLFLSKNFDETEKFTKDVQLTGTDEYEYSPLIKDRIVIYRRAGNYFLKEIDSVSKAELQLTKDESDSISYQIIGISGQYKSDSDTLIRILFARYDNTGKETYIFPNFITENVSTDKQKRGVSRVKLLKYIVRNLRDSLKYLTTEIHLPDSIRYSVQYTLYTTDSKNIIFDAETLDRHKRKLFNYDIDQKKVTEIYTEYDTAWYERHGNPTISINDSEIVFESEVSGYNSLYKIKTDGSGLMKIAGDNYTIAESVYDRKNGRIYFTANRENPTEWNLYETDFSGSFVNKLTEQAGGYEDLYIAPDGKNLFFRYSAITSPPELCMIELATTTERQITNTISPKFSDVKWKIPELISYNNEEDGEKIYAYLYKPDSIQGLLRSARKSYPLICFAHGQGYLQNITKGFSPYQDNFMVNTFLTSKGFMVLDIDYRGSMGYGKNFRNKTYRNLGYREVSDYISGINYLDGLGMIDRNKVGIYGGSYGGFISLMAAFRHPEYFKAAAALRPVSDWRNYAKGNWWFTMGRLGDYTKEENKIYYEISSPITYANELTVPLFITHGMLDENVYFQQSVLLVEKLIEEKKDFEIMFYPKEYHGFHLQSSWLDQYRRIYDFFERNLKK